MHVFGCIPILSLPAGGGTLSAAGSNVRLVLYMADRGHQPSFRSIDSSGVLGIEGGT